MAAAAPFEPRPRLAVAVSGGADSLALMLLASRWTRVRDGDVVALTVDHGLRPESGDEARRVAGWCRLRGIPHRKLAWHDRPPLSRGDLQTAARTARYRLLDDWCRAHGVLHLLIAHHRDDQAETFLLRLGHDSGLAGLAGVALVREGAHARLIRPLLDVPRGDLAAYLTALGQDWIEDPSNRDPAFARVRLRGLAAHLEEDGLDAAALAGLAARFGGIRHDLEARIAALLARTVEPHPAGFATVDRAALTAAGPALGARALARVLAMVSGTVYPPRSARIERLFAMLSGTSLRGRTLAGCRILPAGSGKVLVCRELAVIAPPVPAHPGTFHWDGRFRIRVAGAAGPGAMLGALGVRGWADVCRRAPHIAETPGVWAIPAPVRAGLPSLIDGQGPLAVPHIGYRRSGAAAGTLAIVEIRPDVPETLGGPRFAQAPGNL